MKDLWLVRLCKLHLRPQALGELLGSIDAFTTMQDVGAPCIPAEIQHLFFLGCWKCLVKDLRFDRRSAI
jgi:hypothetical protein